MGSWARPVEGQVFCLSVSEEAPKKLRVVLQCIFGHDFLSVHTTIALGVENYPSPSMSCCTDDQAQLLPCFNRPLKSEFRKYISLRKHFCL